MGVIAVASGPLLRRTVKPITLALLAGAALAAAQENAPTANEVSEPIPVWTRPRSVMPGLPAQLVALLASDDPRFSRAVFVAADGRQLTYGVGDTVASGILLDAIERDYVVLNIGGQAQAMRLRDGSAVPEALALMNPKPIRSAQGAAGAVAHLEAPPYAGPTVSERLAAMRTAVPAQPAPLPATAASRFDPRRGKDDPKLAPVPAKIKDR